MKRIGLGLVCLWAGTLSAVTLTWNGSDGGTWDAAAQNWLDEASSPAAWADGSVAMFAAAGTVNVSGSFAAEGMTFGPAAGTVALAGGTVTTAAVTAQNDCAAIGSALNGVGGLTVGANDGLYYDGTPDLTDSVLFTNVNLSDVIGVSGVCTGTWMNTGNRVRVVGLHFTNDGQTATVQFQVVDGNVKCVLVQLAQSGDNIVGRTVGAWYCPATASGGYLGMDFVRDTNIPGITVANKAVPSNNYDGYGISKLRLILSGSSMLAARHAVLSGATVPNGLLTVSGSVGVAGTLGENGILTTAVTNFNRFFTNPQGGTWFAGMVSGDGDIICPADATVAATTVSASNTGYLPKTATVFFPNTQLSRIVSASGDMSGGWFSKGAWHLPAEPYIIRKLGSTMKIQLENYLNGYTRGCEIELAQSGPDVTARIIDAGYREVKYTENRSGVWTDVELMSDKAGPAASAAEDGYGIYNFKIVLGNAGTAFAGNINVATGATVVNGRAYASQTSAISSGSAGIVINDGGTLVVDNNNVSSPGPSTSVGGDKPILINRGGTLQVQSRFCLGFTRPIEIDGGQLYMPVKVWLGELNLVECCNYINHLILKNGAQVTGNLFRAGLGFAPFISVGGSSASTIATGIVLVKEPSTWAANEAMTFSVEDATGDSAADLTVSGNILDLPGYVGLRLVKLGAGTLSLSGVTNSFAGSVTASAGTISLDSDNAVMATNALIVSGGTIAANASGLALGAITLTSGTFAANAAGLAVPGLTVSGGTLALNASGVTVGDVTLASGSIAANASGDSAGVLTLSGDATIALGASGAVAFAKSSAAAWTAGKVLTVTGDLGKTKLRFGTDATGLAAAQVAQILSGGRHVIITSEGYIVPAPKGSVMQLR
jgi:autotransporter-associated beta strand protein